MKYSCLIDYIIIHSHKLPFSLAQEQNLLVPGNQTTIFSSPVVGHDQLKVSHVKVYLNSESSECIRATLVHKTRTYPPFHSLACKCFGTFLLPPEGDASTL